MVSPALVLPHEPDDRWHIARQMGVEDAVIHPLEIGDGRTHWTYDDLQGLSNWLTEVGLRFSVLEGAVPISDRIRLGREGRYDDIEVFKQFLRNCGEIGIPVVCYDWMAGEDNSNPGYHTKGRLFAIGYMRGLREQVQTDG